MVYATTLYVVVGQRGTDHPGGVRLLNCVLGVGEHVGPVSVRVLIERSQIFEGRLIAELVLFLKRNVFDGKTKKKKT